MTLAIMQPYFFPYVGYFQLLFHCDEFVFFNDVNFIKKGYIHRNHILIDSSPRGFSIPLAHASQNSTINTQAVHPSEYVYWRKKFLKSLHHAYGQSPYYKEVTKLVAEVLVDQPKSIAELAQGSITAVCKYLGLDRIFHRADQLDYHRGGSGAQKILSLCGLLAADHYVNPLGGARLYSFNDFKKQGVELEFLQAVEQEYPQQSAPFVPGLSILDMLFNCDKELVISILALGQLVGKGQLTANDE